MSGADAGAADAGAADRAPASPAADPVRVGWLEILVAAGLLLIVGLVTYAGHIRDAGFYSDDWSTQDSYRHLPDAGYWSLVRSSAETFGGKPLLAVLLAVPVAVFEDSTSAHLALAMVTGAATSLCFFTLLRTIGVARFEAGVMAVLSLAFPWSSSARFWATVGVNNIAVCLFLLGAVVAIRSVRRTGPDAVVTHGLAVVLYVASVLTYEVTGIAACCIGALYLRFTNRRAALARWAADIVGVGATVVWSARVTNKYIPPLREQIEFLRESIPDAFGLIARAAAPFGVPGSVVICLMAAVVLTALVVRRRLAVTDPARARLTTWLGIVAGGTAGVAAAYAVFVPSAYYTALKQGLENRVNIFAALPVIVVAYGTWILAAQVLAIWKPAVAALLAPVVAVMLVVAYSVRLRSDGTNWTRSAVMQEQVLTVLRRIPAPPPDSTVYTFGHHATVSTRLPVFADTWDLSSAVRLVFDEPSLRAYPVFEGAELICADVGIDPRHLPGLHHDMAAPSEVKRQYSSPWYGLDAGTPYGRAVLVDVSDGRSALISNREECKALLPTFPPGPFNQSHR